MPPPRRRPGSQAPIRPLVEGHRLRWRRHGSPIRVRGLCYFLLAILLAALLGLLIGSLSRPLYVSESARRELASEARAWLENSLEACARAERVDPGCEEAWRAWEEMQREQ